MEKLLPKQTNKKGYSVMKKTYLVLVVLFVFASGFLFAGDKPLSLKESDPEHEDVDVPVDIEITLEFSNNVVNMKVSEHNAECFSLLDPEGEELEIEIVFPDDQLEPEKKRIIYIIPVEPLESSTQYTVVVSEELMAKNGNQLGEEVEITFVTAE
jgi:hypothetical protein